MGKTLNHLAIVTAVAVVVLFTNLGTPRLWDRDEPRNAGCAHEMLQRGDWLTPVFNAELRTHKPVLLYWLMMSAYSLFGVNEWSARFWSAACGVGSVWLTYGIGCRLFHRQVAVWSALILATSLMFGVAGRAATPDSILIFCMTAALYIYVVGCRGWQHLWKATNDGNSDQLQRSAWFPRFRIAALMYATMGVAILAKGPVGMVVPTAVIGMFLLIAWLPDSSASPNRSAWFATTVRVLRVADPRHFFKTCWSMRPLTAMVIAAAVALPWYVGVGLRTDGEWLRGFLLEHNFGRATQAMEGHGGSLWYYPAAILVGFFPWSVLAVPTLLVVIRAVRRADQETASIVFLSCWVCVIVGLFSLASTKLPSYVTPAYPAVALLTGYTVHRWSLGAADVSAAWLRVALGVLVLVGLVIAIAIPLAAQRYLPGDAWLGCLGLIPILGGCATYWTWQRGWFELAPRALAATSVAMATVLFGFVAVRVDRHQHSDALLAEIQDRSHNPEIATYGCLEPSWVFYAGRPVYETDLLSTVGDATQLNWNPANQPRKPKLQPDAFLRDTSGDHFLITTRGQLKSLTPLPPHVGILAEVPYFLKNERLVLIGPTEPPTARRPSPTTR